MTLGPYRCDGCGTEDPEKSYQSGSYPVRYCLHCDRLRRYFAISLEGHPQYKLDEKADQIAEDWGR